MPAPLSCKSATAYDSLPRQHNAKRTSSALHKLQSSKKSQQQQHTANDSLGEFGLEAPLSSATPRPSHDGPQGITRPSSSQGFASPRSHSSSNVHQRKRTSSMIPNRGVGVGGRSRANRKVSSGVASSDLPLVSSDLDQSSSNGTHSYQYGVVGSSSRAAAIHVADQGPRKIDDDDDNEDDEDAGYRSDDVSIRPIGGPLAAKNYRPSSPSPLAHRPLSPVSPKPVARGPIASSSPKKKRADAEGAVVSSPRPPAPSPGPARKRVVTKAMIGKPTNFQHTGHIGAGAYGAATAMGSDPKAARELQLQLSEVAAALNFGDELGSSMPVKAGKGEEHDTKETEEVRDPVVEHEVKTRARSDATLIEDVAAGEEAPSPPSPTPPATPRKEIPAITRVAVPTLDDEKEEQLLPAAEQEAVVIEEVRSKEPSSASTLVLDRTPSSASGVSRSSSTRRKPVSVPNKLAALYDEFKQEEPFSLPQPPPPQNLPSSKQQQQQPLPLPQPQPAPLAKAKGLSPLIEDEEEMRKLTYRLNGKRMVPGPGGDYITDTAHGRWDKAMTEITRALKSQGLEESGADYNDDEDLAEGLRRADDVLGRLNHGVL